MADAKIQIKIGMIEFTGEGTEKWLESQLDKILKESIGSVSIENLEAEVWKSIDTDPFDPTARAAPINRGVMH